MVIGRATTKDPEGEMLILGLSHVNIARLLKGEPIHIRRVSHGDGVPEGWEILIMTGKDERAIAAEMRKVGAIGEDTVIPTSQLGRDSNS